MKDKKNVMVLGSVAAVVIIFALICIFRPSTNEYGRNKELDGYGFKYVNLVDVAKDKEKAIKNLKDGEEIYVYGEVIGLYEEQDLVQIMVFPDNVPNAGLANCETFSFNLSGARTLELGQYIWVNGSYWSARTESDTNHANIYMRDCYFGPVDTNP